MARTHFTYTFTNAQPGAGVTFSAPVYADATTTVSGRRLTLSSSLGVSVYADAAFLIATTVDGLGNPISATATVAAATVTDADGVAGTSPFPATTALAAPAISYDHTVSSLAATNVKAALDEVVARIVVLETP